MHGRDTLGRTGEQAEDGKDRKRAVLGDRRLQRRAGNVHRREPWNFAVWPGVSHRRGVVALYLLRRGYLPAEPTAELGVVGENLLYDLDRERVTAGTKGEIYISHSARADART